MRRRGKGQTVPQALDFLERNYRELSRRLHDRGVSVGLLELTDLFHETVLYIATDHAVERITTDTEFVAHFEYRMNMIRFQTLKDHREELKKNADYQQTAKNQAEEW